MRGNIGKILWGLVLVVIGVIWGLNALEIIDINLFFNGWWTLFIIVPCTISLFEDKGSKTGDLIGILIGVALLLAAQDVFSFEYIWKLIVPVIIVLIGLSMIFGSALKTKVNEKIKSLNNGELEAITATFGEQIVNKEKEEFNGAALDSVFGSIVIDLDGAKLKDETIIKASAIFGGIDIIVPKDVEVKVKATPIFGGVDNRCKNKDGKKVIYIDAFCLFGGISIK